MITTIIPDTPQNHVEHCFLYGHIVSLQLINAYLWLNYCSYSVPSNTLCMIQRVLVCIQLTMCAYIYICLCMCTCLTLYIYVCCHFKSPPHPSGSLVMFVCCKHDYLTAVLHRIFANISFPWKQQSMDHNNTCPCLNSKDLSQMIVT